jgi:hypothetical protein
MKINHLVLSAACSAIAPLPAIAGEQAPSATLRAERDGRHDFDFTSGAWKTHIRRRMHPLAGSSEMMELNGTVLAHKIWGGRAFLEEIEADGPKGHWQGLSLFLYNPEAHQWSQTFISSKSGAFTGGSLVGSFKDGRGELFSTDTLDGRQILVRGAWSDVRSTSHRYEESYSNDGGKTWEVEFSAEKTKISASEHKTAPNTDGSHDFDFDFGTWKTHSTRLMHPLSGANDWRDMDGVTTVTKIWDGRANLAEYQATGTAGAIELLALRIYNPATKEWSINFATPTGGALGSVPGIGEFKNGRVDFYDQESINGKAVLVRFSMWGVTPDTAQSEQAFSADGGKTWEVNWVNKYTRAKD